MAMVSYGQQLPRVAFQLRQSEKQAHAVPTSYFSMWTDCAWLLCVCGGGEPFCVDQRSRVCVEMQLSNSGGGLFSCEKHPLHLKM